VQAFGQLIAWMQINGHRLVNYSPRRTGVPVIGRQSGLVSRRSMVREPPTWSTCWKPARS
jgi:hypothetical protein